MSPSIDLPQFTKPSIDLSIFPSVHDYLEGESNDTFKEKDQHDDQVEQENGDTEENQDDQGSD